MENNDTESWKFEFELRQFVDRVTRWPLTALKAGITADTPFWPFHYIIEYGRENVDLFSIQLRTRLTKAENWKPIAIDLQDRFLVGINIYFDWYNKNKTAINDLELNHIFDTMNSFIESTEKEIYKYFPELKNNNKPLVADYSKLSKINEVTFLMLFKNPLNEPKIMEQISEFLNDKGEWTTEPKVRHLVALFEVLKTKGYLKTIYSNPTIASAFKNKFKVDFVAKNFQPTQRKEALDYIEQFNSIGLPKFN